MPKKMTTSRRSLRKIGTTRKTKETHIKLQLELDGKGSAKLNLQDRWLKHMLEALCKFSGFDLFVEADGDLLHHIDEDIALTFGKVLRDSIVGRPIRRLGSGIVAMDDALVMVSVDLVERPFADVSLPDQMLEHFLRSFALEGRFTLHNVIMKGKNHHHISEACFKALGMALKEATSRSSDSVMSTKGKVIWK